MNPFERAARSDKVLAITATIDSLWTAQDDIPTARDVRDFTAQMWRDLAKLAKVNPPSQTTIDAIVRHFEDREGRSNVIPFSRRSA